MRNIINSKSNPEEFKEKKKKQCSPRKVSVDCKAFSKTSQVFKIVSWRSFSEAREYQRVYIIDCLSDNRTSKTPQNPLENSRSRRFFLKEKHRCAIL